MMVDSSSERGHKRPLPPPQSRATVLDELKEVQQWTSIDGGLLICGLRKRPKLNHQLSPNLDLGRSILRTPAKIAAARVVTPRATEQEHIGSAEKEVLLQDVSPQQPHTHTNEDRRQKIPNVPEDKSYDIDEKLCQTTDQNNAHEDEEQEATRLAQLVNMLAKDTDQVISTVTITPQAEQIKELRARLEREGEARSRALRAANLKPQVGSSTSSSSSRMDFINSEQSTCAHRVSTNPLRDSSDISRQISRLPSIAMLADEVDNEALLVIAQSYSRGEDSNLQKTGNSKAKNMTPIRTVQGDSIPSRATAQTYRTENIHLHSSSSTDEEVERKRTMHEAGARRLLEIKAIQQARTKLIPHAEFIDRPVQDHSSSMQRLSKDSFQSVASNSDNWRPLVSKKPASQPPILVDAPIAYPLQGQLECLALPNDFEKKTKEMQDIITQHEIYKLRLRNVTAIPALMENIAIAGSAKPFNACERQELHEAKTYLTKVLEESLCGSRMRKRILDVRDNMKRRANNLPPPPKDAVETFYNTLFRQDLQDRLRIEEIELYEKIQSFGYLRSAANHAKRSKPKSASKNRSKDAKNHSKYKRSCSTNARANALGDTVLDLSEVETPPIVRLSKSEQIKNPQLTLSAKLEAKEARLQAQLKAFDTQLCSPTTTPRHAIDESIDDNDEDVASEISEEDEGADYYSGARVVEAKSNNVSTAQDKGQTREHRTEQTEVGITSSSSSQQPHESLREQLRGKQQTQEIRSQQYAQKPDLGLLHKAREKALNNGLASDDDEAGSEPPCDDSEEDESVQSDDEERTCYRYHVNICATGIDNLEDATEHRLNTFLKLDKANEQAGSLAKDIMNDHVSDTNTAAGKAWKKSEEFQGGLVEHNLALGKDQQVVCRIWVEQEEYLVSGELFQDARFKRACISKPVYFVMWEQTLRNWVEGIKEQVGASVAEIDEIAAVKALIVPKVSVEGIGAEEDPSTERVVSTGIQPGVTFTSDPRAKCNNIDKADDDNDDELFGTLSPESMDTLVQVRANDNSDNLPVPTSTDSVVSEVHDDVISVSRPSPADIRLTSTIALANRFAKERFMTWWTGHLRGSINWNYIRHEEKCMDAELESHGNLRTWEKEEEFMVEYEDGTKARDELRVWVEEKKVYGPAN